MPSNHKELTNSATSSSTNVGGESFSRLSRWFSIRRSSYYQYDLGGRATGGGGSLDKSGGGGGNNCDTIKEHNNGTNTTTKNGRNGSKSDASLFRYNSNASDKCEDFTYTSATDLEECQVDSPLLPPLSTIGRQSPPCLPAPPSGLTEQQIKRRHIVAAIVHSENSYVATLQRLVNNYKKSLEDSSPSILNSTKITTLFYKLPEILQIHSLFRIALADYVKNWDRNENLGDVFIATFSKPVVLEVYSGFINNFSAAMELAKMETKRKSALADFFNVKQISNHDRLSFFGLMVKPVQRFPQFILFLQDLLKHTSKEHHDRVSLQLALTQLESLAEMLNECKREAEQHQAFKDMLANISGTFNIRSLLLPNMDNSTYSPKNQRHLLRQDNMQQMDFNQSGFIFKVKQRRLLLLNDRIICVSGGTKQPYEFSGTTEKLRFKWMYPLNEVEIVDNSTSTTLSRILTAGGTRRESIVSMNGSHHSFDSSTTATNTMTSSTTTATSAANSSADNLCTEMANLMADYEMVSRINDMVMNLKSHYDELNTEVTKRVLNSIQRSIQEKDEEMFWVDSCCLQIVVKNKSGNKETFTFQTESPNVKKEWVTELRLAQLALDTNNSPAWDVPESELKQPLIRMPLFVKAQTIFKSQHPTEARCGCYFTQSPLDDAQSTMRPQPFKKRTKQNYIWICSNDETNTFVTILLQNQQQANLLKTCETFTLAKQQVTAVEFVRAKIIHEDRYVSITTDTIWLATQSKQILVYSTRVGEKNREMARISVPDAVTFILFHMNNVFVSMVNGQLLVFRNLGADFGGLVNIGAATIDLNAFEVICLNKEYAITSLIPINENVYAACGKHVWIFNGQSSELVKQHEIPNRNNDGTTTTGSATINLMAHSGVGLWISLKNSSVICLYHTETFRHLQDLNIASNVLRVTSFKKDTSKSGSSTVIVTALMACSGLLWVGTNVGIALTIPLPRLEGVPIIKVGITISYHSHFGPIKFFLPLITSKATATTTLKTTASFKKSVKISCDSPNKSSREKLSLSRQESLVEQSIQESLLTPTSETSLQPTVTPSKRRTLDILNSPLLNDRKSMRNFFSHLSANSSKTLPSGFSRKSSTLSASMRSTGSSSLNSEHGTCDVYGLYRDLIYVKEDYNEETRTGNLLNSSFECLRKSDPELSSITAKISTLDRRLKMKTSRPRSLDLSNWSVGSHSSSSHSYLYSSSGSDDNMSLRLFNNNNNIHNNNNNNNNHSKSVSRSNSNASQKINDNELMDISETVVATTTTTPSSNRRTPPILLQRQSTINDYDISSVSGTYTKLKKNKKPAGGFEDAHNAANNRKTIITLMGGRGYINWRHIWYNSSTDFQASPNTSPSISATGTTKHQRNSSMSTFNNLPNSNDAHILIWEKKL